MSESFASPGAELPPEHTSGKAIASLVCGLLSFFCMILTGLPAIILGILGLIDTSRGQGRVRGQGLAICGIVLGGLGILWTCIGPALFLPAISAVRAGQRRTVSLNNMKQIGLALLLYENQKRQIPAAAGGEVGQPPHSWRVDVLPYLEQASLHAKYDFDEPWNGPNNRKLIDAIPSVFRAPGESDEKPGMTNVVAIVGDETMWPPDQALGVRDASDGTTKTIMLVEVQGTNIAWTEPRDMSFDEFVAGINQPGGPKSIYPGGIVVLFVDGSVRFLDADTSRDVLKAMATRNGGEAYVLP